MFIEIIGVITILMAIRAVVARDRAEKLLYINVIGFCVSALIALYIKTPFGLVLAATFEFGNSGSFCIFDPLKKVFSLFRVFRVLAYRIKLFF